MRLDISRR